MLISLALTVSFATKAAANINNSILKDNNNTEKTVKNTDANIYGHVKDSKTGEHLPGRDPEHRMRSPGILRPHLGLVWFCGPGVLRVVGCY